MGTNSVADGNDNFCDCAIVRYSTAYAGEASDATTAAGTVSRTQSATCLLSRRRRHQRPVLGLDHCSEREPHRSQDVVGVGSGRIVIDRLLIGQLQYYLGRWCDGDAGGVELHATFAGRRVQVGSCKAARLEVFEGVPIERNCLPRALQYRSQGEVVSDFAR